MTPPLGPTSVSSTWTGGSPRRPAAREALLCEALTETLGLERPTCGPQLMDFDVPRLVQSRGIPVVLEGKAWRRRLAFESKMGSRRPWSGRAVAPRRR